MRRHPGRVVRARWAILSGLAFFVLAQLVFAALVELRWRAVRDPVHVLRLRHFQGKVAAAQSRSARPEDGRAKTILFLGTSRFEMGVQTKVLERRLEGELGRVSQERVAILDDLLTRLKGAGVPAAVVVMPEGPAFRSLCPPHTWRQVEECLAGLSRRYGVPFLNLGNWIDDESEFNDSHHLTAEGADRFSERLAHEVLAPMLRRLEGGGARAQR